MKMHFLYTYEYEYADGRTEERGSVLCSGQQWNARIRRTATDDWDKVTCRRCKRN